MEKIGVDYFCKVKMISHLKKIKDAFYVIGKQASIEENKYLSNLYQVEEGMLRQLTFTNDVGSYDYVDGKIVFRSGRDQGEEVNYYYLPEFGEATKFLSLKEKVNKIYWMSLDHFLFTATTKLPSVEFEEGKDCRVFEEVPFWFNGAGDVSKLRTSLFSYNKGEVKQITTPTMNINSVAIAPDHSYALIIGKEFEGMRNNGDHLFIYRFNEEGLVNIDLFEGADYYAINFKNNHEAVIVINKNDQYDGLENPGFYLYNVESKEVKMINSGDPYGLGNSEGSDIKMGNDSSSILFDETGFAFITTAPSNAPLAHMDYNGNVTMITKENVMCQEAILVDGKYYAIMMLGNQANELYEIGDTITQLTHINDHLLEEYSISTPIEMEYTTRGNMTLNGWVMLPIGYEKGKKYPTILDVHGGPKTIYGSHFFHEMQYWTNEGYVVIFTNIRGSDGRGNEFCDIRGKYGTIDYDDLMDFVDAAIAKFDCIDEDHMGITGGSYGGFMTNWVIGHTNRFKAAASQRSISNWVSFSNISDVGFMFKSEISSTTWDNVELMWQQSPLKYANKCTTPTLFIHSDHDYRCPMAEGLQMFYALKVHGVPARLCLFKDETHELSRSGRPLNRIRRLKEITAWMDQYLK